MVTEQEIHDYYYELGRFFHGFASVEFHLRLLLQGLSGTDEATAKALFYSTRVQEGIDTTKRLYKARSKPVPDMLTDALTQLAHINTARNSLVHHGSIFGETVTTSNWAIVLSPQDMKEFPASAETLGNMSADLARILSVLGYFGRTGLSRWKGRTEFERWLESEHSQWLYKPPKQGGRPNDTRAKSQLSADRKRPRKRQSPPS